MGFSKESLFSNISQRKILEYNTFFSVMLLSILVSDVYFLLKYYSFYSPSLKIVATVGMGGLFTGNLLGRFLFSKQQNHRPVVIISQMAYILFFLLYILRNILMPESDEFFLVLFFLFKYSIPAIFFVAMLFFGIMLNYTVRVSCNDSVDKMQGPDRLVPIMLSGMTAGILFSALLYSFAVSLLFAIPLALLLIPPAFLIDIPYRQASFYSAEAEEDKESGAPSLKEKGSDAALFTYLLFLCMIVYAYLGFSSINKYYGDQIYVNLAFLLLLFIFMLAGYGVGRFIRVSNLYIYGQSFFPVGFLVFLILLMSFNGQMEFFGGILLFAPVAFLLGLLLFHSIRAVINQYENAQRAVVIEFSMLILPAPVMIALSLMYLSNLWFYGMICVVMIINVVIPAISIINTDISGYKKGLYFFVSLFFLPLFIFIILFFKISLDNNAYAARVNNFEELRTVNYNADYIRNQAMVTMNGQPVFSVSDSVVRNYKRALVPLALYNPAGKKILFIDGNQRFFRNPVIGYFKYSLCLDELSDRDVDYNRLPISGTQKYIPDSGPVLNFIDKNRTLFFSIVDIPNLLDQNMNAFRFSSEYYEIVKKHLDRKGIFAQVFSIPGCRRELLARALTDLKRSFKNHAVYYFSNVLIVFASDDGKALAVNEDKYEQLISFFNAHGDLNRLFMNEPHVCSHLAATRLEGILPGASGMKLFPALYLVQPDKVRLKKSFIDDYLSKNRLIMEQIERAPDEQAFIQTLAASFLNDDAVLSLLKRTEQAEAREDYRSETRLLFDLKKQAEFKVTLQSYVLKMLEYKEKYYYNIALNFEKNKKWSEAQDLYRAVLTINPDNFNAHYRMALLCITLQDIEGSFSYLQQAMRINKDHPKVLMQMGVLYFSSGKTEEAIEYFNKALQQNEKTPQIYRYLGMCHEKKGDLYEAEKNYAKALAADPNDTDTKARLEKVRQQIDKESKKWETPEQKNESDVEQDAEMPLPVSKGAYDIRLKDDELSLPVIDPITGEEIKTDKNTEGSVQGSQPQTVKPQVQNAEKK